MVFPGYNYSEFDRFIEAILEDGSVKEIQHRWDEETIPGDLQSKSGGDTTNLSAQKKYLSIICYIVCLSMFFLLLPHILSSLCIMSCVHEPGHVPC